MVVFGMIGMRASYKYGYRRRFALAYLCLTLVGVGSVLFHSMLTYHTQLLDELPMLFACSVFLYTSFALGDSRRPLLAIFLALCPLVITYFYVHSGHAEFFQNAYTVQVIAIITRHTYLLTQLPPRFRAVGDMLMYYGIGSYLTATIFWVIDNLLCYSHLTPLKQQLGWPLRILLEFHGWWHLLSGLGTFVSIAYSIYVREILHHGGKKPVSILWIGKLLPVVVTGRHVPKLER